MPLSLTPQRKEEVFLLIKRAFSDFRYFDELVTDPLRKCIEDATKVDIDFQITKSIVERYVVNAHSYQTKDQQEVLNKIRIILTAAAVYLCYLSSPPHTKIITTIDELLEEYPSFAEQLDRDDPADLQELEYLVKFRNFMVIAIKLVQAKGNKLFLLRVVERLEGSNNEYITGTGQKPTVNRRVFIFHQESDVTIVKKASKRKRTAEEIEAENMEKEEKKKLKLLKKQDKQTTTSGKVTLTGLPPFPVKKPEIIATLPTTEIQTQIQTQTQPQLQKPPLPQPVVRQLSDSTIPSSTVAGMINFEKLFSDKDNHYDPSLDSAELLLGEPYAVNLTEELFGKNKAFMKGNY